MRIAHTAKVMFSQFLSFCLQGGGGGVSGKVHSEHIVATEVLMPVGGGWGVGCPGKCTLSTLLLQKCSCPWGGGVSRKVYSEHIVATKVLPPMRGMQSIFELPSCFLYNLQFVLFWQEQKCVISTMHQQTEDCSPIL